jgi:hypothetical protein
MPAKVEAINNWPKPTNVHEVRQFLGLCTYYRKFVRSFANMAAALHELLKESDERLRKKKFRPINWTARCQAAFVELKKAMTSRPVLAVADPTKPYRIETDASEWAIGIVLMQQGDDGKWHPIAFDGRKLNAAERNYPTQEKELLAIKEALRRWDHYIDNGKPITIVTDHESLQYLTTTKNYSKRLARWVEEFQMYDLEIKYRKGSEAVVPDAISRRPDFVEAGPANEAERPASMLNAINAWQSAGKKRLRSLLNVTEEEWYPAMIEYLKLHELPADRRLRKAIEETAKDFQFRTESLYIAPSRRRGPTTVAPRQTTTTHDQLLRITDLGEAPYLEIPFRKDFLRRMHDECGHMGYPGLLGAIGTRAWWPTMRSDIEATARECPNCQVSQGLRKGLEREEQFHMVKKGIQPFERWGVDLIGRLPVTPNGNKWIITAIDYATGWPVAKAVPDATDEAIAEFLHEEIFVNYGAFDELVSDNGRNLLSRVVEVFVKILKAKHRTTTPSHPRTNGKNENLNGLLGRMLTKYLVGKPTRLWDEYLHLAIFAARIHNHAQTGRSPFYLLYGVEPKLPGDDRKVKVLGNNDERLSRVLHARALANEKLLAHAIKRKVIRDQQVMKSSLRKGQWVLVRNESPQKFQSKWFGPYQIVKAHPLGTYALREPGGYELKNLVNGQRLVEANVGDDPTRLWTSAALNRKLRDVGLSIEKPVEVRKVLDEAEAPPPSYRELSQMTKAEWDGRKHSGERLGQVGEGVLANQRGRSNKARRGGRKTAAGTGRPGRCIKESSSKQEAGSEKDSTVSDDEMWEGISGNEKEKSTTRRDARELDFEGPFAVVIPSRQEK